LATVRITETVKTIAHWIPITKRALADAAQMRALIDDFLLYGLEEELEDQMVSGDGTGENMTGIANVSGTQTQAWDTNLFTTTRRAISKAQNAGRPNGFLLNPADIERLDLEVDGNGQFFFGGPAAGGGVPTLWRIPVVQSLAVPAGVGFVADWRAAVLYDREQANITTSDSHGEMFIRNMVAVLAESRHAFTVVKPSAFVEIDLTA
jgi:HK97 family phage major capsid protein